MIMYDGNWISYRVRLPREDDSWYWHWNGSKEIEDDEFTDEGVCYCVWLCSTLYIIYSQFTIQYNLYIYNNNIYISISPDRYNIITTTHPNLIIT